MRPVRLLLLLGGLAMGMPLPLDAQTLQGDVTDSTTHRLVAGGMVLLLKGKDSIIASTTTTERGTYAFGVVPAGEYHLRVLRIGSRAWDSSRFTLAAGQTRADHWRIASEPVQLDDIVVVAHSACRASVAADAAVATLWEEARKALKLADGSAGTRPLDYRMRVTTSHLDPTGQLSTSETLGRLGTGAWPIRSAAAQSLLDHGYVQPADSIRGPRYFGPDPTVFFSSSFQESHCFKAVDSPRKHRELIGVAFEPVPTRTLPDIRGAMWLDRSSAELRQIAFDYTGLWPWVPPGTAGGELTFTRLESGDWIITGWEMRAPVAMAEPLKIGARPDERVLPYFGNRKVKLGGFLQEVGQVDEVRAADSSVVWRAPVSPRD